MVCFGILAATTGLSLGVIASHLLPAMVDNGRVDQSVSRDASNFDRSLLPSESDVLIEAGGSLVLNDADWRELSEFSRLDASRPGDELPDGAVADITRDSKIIRTAEATADTAAGRRASDTNANDSAVPRTLTPPRNVSRLLADASNPQSTVLDRLLADELPHANEAEREVWRDVLTGLPLNDAREIVRMRTRLSTGPIIGPGLSGSLERRESGGQRESGPGPSRSSEVEPPLGDDAWTAIPEKQQASLSQTLDAFDRASQILLHNIANADAVGFIPTVPLMAEAAVGFGTDFLGERLDISDWKTTSTGRPSDLAPAAGTFLAVETAEGVRLTLVGTVAAADGRLGIAFADGFAPLVPAVQIAEGETVAAAAKRVAAWSVEAPQALDRVGGGRYRTTAESGEPVVGEASVRSGLLVVGDVDVAALEQKLRLLSARRVLLQHSR